MATIYIILIAIWVIGLVWVYVYWHERIYNLKHTPKFTSHNRHCISQMSEFGQFLTTRGEDMDIKNRCVDSTSYSSTFRDICLGELPEMFVLVRECHLLGCEIIIRQMGEEDVFLESEKRKIIKEYRTGDFRRK